MRTIQIRTKCIVFRYAGELADKVIAIPAKSPRVAYEKSGHGTYVGIGFDTERWIKIDLSEAINAVLASKYYPDASNEVLERELRNAAGSMVSL